MQIIFLLTFLLLRFSLAHPMLQASPSSPKHPHKQSHKIIALGDIHGDMSQFKRTLIMAGIIHPTSFKWIAKDTLLVSTGDSVDRGNDTVQVYALWRKLAFQAPFHNSRVVNLLGNHEVLNLVQDEEYLKIHYKMYISQAELNSYSNVKGKQLSEHELKELRQKEFSAQGTIGTTFKFIATTNMDMS